MEPDQEYVWFDHLPTRYPWSSLWYGFYRCECAALRSNEPACPVCGRTSPCEPIDPSRLGEPPTYVTPGAEGRYEDYVYLELIEREWKRPTLDVETLPRPRVAGRHMADKVGIVLLFWTYFESRIDRLIDLGLSYRPAEEAENLRIRYRSVGARMDRLYKILFATTYNADLADAGYAPIASLLQEIQTRRNAFAHGDPVAIDDSLVERLVTALRIEHLSWIAAYNRRLSVLRARTDVERGD
ncbi:hypothetical protein [Variovorax sp. DAIF25]|uniref:hypothetical protein n=1 Tax=Variovorax sp. DAIF25 TaxID=3080983 RepID=UPI003D6A87E5